MAATEVERVMVVLCFAFSKHSRCHCVRGYSDQGGCPKFPGSHFVFGLGSSAVAEVFAKAEQRPVAVPL